MRSIEVVHFSKDQGLWPICDTVMRLLAATSQRYLCAIEGYLKFGIFWGFCARPAKGRVIDTGESDTLNKYF
jgi:hypothetical protein